MKLVVEIDLNAPDHDTISGAFAGVFALLRSIMDQGGIPPQGDLRRVFEISGQTTMQHYVLCEGADRANGELATSRVLVMKAPFANHIYAKDQAAAAGVQLTTVQAKYEFEYNPNTGALSVSDDQAAVEDVIAPK